MTVNQEIVHVLIIVVSNAIPGVQFSNARFSDSHNGVAKSLTSRIASSY